MAHLRFGGKVAVVTGAGRGIGREEAMFLARRGASVVVNDLGGSTMAGDNHPSPRGKSWRRSSPRGMAVANASPIATEEGAKEIIETALDNFGRVDILVNNAGILDSDIFPNVTPDEVQRQLSVHTLGYFNVTRAAWPHVIQ